MKHSVLSGLMAILLALVIAFCGVSIPRLLIQRQTDQLTTASELLSSDQLAPYSAGMDSPVRIQKLSNMVMAALSAYGTSEVYQNIRTPLDTELSREAAVGSASAFLAELLTAAEDMGLDTLASPSYYGYDAGMEAAYAARDVFLTAWEDSRAAGNTLADLLESYFYDGTFWVSPEDSSLALWLLLFDAPFFCGALLIDAVTGIPIFIDATSVNGTYEPDYLIAVSRAYQACFPDRFQDLGSEVAHSIRPSDQLYYWEPADCYSTTSGDVTLELLLDYYQESPFIPVFRLYA